MIDLNGNTPMLSACQLGDFQMVKLLNSLDCSQRNEDNDANEANDCGGDLTCSGATEDTNQGISGPRSTRSATPITRRSNTDGWTPFLLACAGEHLNIMRYLYNHGCEQDIDKANAAGMTPMRYAVAAGISGQSVVRQLQRWGVPILDVTTARLGFFTTPEGRRGETRNSIGASDVDDSETKGVQHQFYEL